MTPSAQSLDIDAGLPTHQPSGLLRWYCSSAVPTCCLHCTVKPAAGNPSSASCGPQSVCACDRFASERYLEDLSRFERRNRCGAHPAHKGVNKLVKTSSSGRVEYFIKVGKHEDLTNESAVDCGEWRAY